MTEVIRNRALFEQTFIEMTNRNIFVNVPVFGLSMFPFYLPNDNIRVVKASGRTLNVGDVIVFSNNGRLIAHRLLKVNYKTRIVISKGDGLITKDKVMPIENVLAVCVAHYRKEREIIWINKNKVKRMIAFVSPYIGFFTFHLARVWNKYSH